ncbi:flavin reductase family protein [Rhodococcus opacus]|uniref:flavin reductase family protein n=1 Tax=Rhodococcus opacus TaxID=37919 RepID=UPI00223645CC|nr:flavin reductase family protein [Rhodococcus opacus]UZG55088.1 flavin reductase family protein [Rhodococcus opacus]
MFTQTSRRAEPAGHAMREDLRRVFGHYPSGVAALAATIDHTDVVLVASSFTVGVSLDPTLVMFAVQRSSTTWPTLRDAPSIGISVLSTGQDHLCRQLANKDKSERWKDTPRSRSQRGAVFIDGACVTLECSIFAEYPAGDHEIVVLEVTSVEADTDHDPLVFHGSRFRPLG